MRVEFAGKRVVPWTGVLLLLLASLTACGSAATAEQPALTPSSRPVLAPTPTTPPPKEARATSLDSLNLTYSGEVRATAQVAVLPKAAGQIVTLNIAVGDSVRAGDLLAELEHDVADNQVRQAEAGLAAAQAGVSQAQAALAAARANLQKALDGPTASEQVAAQKALEAAQAGYQRLVDGPTPEDLIQIESQMKQAEAGVRQAQAAYDQIKWRNDAAAFPQAAQLERATLAYEAARAAYDKAVAGATPDQVKAAEAQVANARVAYERAIEGTPKTTLDALEAQVQQAEAGLAAANAGVDRARSALELAKLQRSYATIVAPISGQVAQVTAQVGNLASPQQPLAVLVSPEVEVVFGVEEAAIAQVVVGDAVEIHVDALPSHPLSGHIVRIAPVVNPATRTVEITAAPDHNDGTLRPGMFASVVLLGKEE